MKTPQVVHQFPPEWIGGTELYTLALTEGANLAAVQTIEEISLGLATLKRPPSEEEE